MKKIKHLICLLGFCLLLTGFVSNVQVLPTTLYIQTETVSKDEINYAKQNFDKFIMSFSEGENDDITYHLGSPFKFNQITHFPIIQGNRIISLLKLHKEKNGKFSWNVGIDFSNELNDISLLSSKESPIYLFGSKNGIHARIGDNLQTLVDTPFELEIAKSTKTSDMFTTVDLFDTLISTTGEVVNSILPVHYLYLDLVETQGKNVWCAAYASSSILRYRSKSTARARDIMLFAYGNIDGLEQKTLSQNKIIQFANSVSSYPLVNKRTLSLSEVTAEISSNRPIYISRKKLK